MIENLKTKNFLSSCIYRICRFSSIASEGHHPDFECFRYFT